ncbi:MAG TPA: alpha/beta fold hydrolase [Chitinophagaceae bacterium]
MKRKNIIRWIKILLVIYIVVGIGLYYLQDRIMFRPIPVNNDHKYEIAQPHKEINIPYSDQSNISIVQFESGSSPAKGVVLYFHGNRANISYYARHAPLFTSRGYEVWMLDYPGYGKSTGERREQVLYEWALTIYKLARTRYSPDSIVLYGKSLGTGIAAQLASVRDCKHLLLETPYYSFPSVIGQYAPVYPFNKMIRYRIPTYEYLQRVTAPVTIFHGTSDGVITYRNSKRLKPFLKKGDEFITIEGGSHNDLPAYDEYLKKMDSILSR